MQCEHALWTKQSMQSTHPSYDETTGRTLAQNHRNKRTENGISDVQSEIAILTARCRGSGIV